MGSVEDVNTHRCNIVFNKTLVFLNKKHKHPKIPRGEGGLDGGLTADILFLFYKKYRSSFIEVSQQIGLRSFETNIIHANATRTG